MQIKLLLLFVLVRVLSTFLYRCSKVMNKSGVLIRHLWFLFVKQNSKSAV